MAASQFHKQPTLVDLEERGKKSPLPKIPKHIGKYKIESLLSRGGMSVLYLGLNPDTFEPLAIKVLSSEFVSNPEVAERFLKEAEIIQMTDHPNIVKLYGHGKWEGGLYIAMEFVQGISLRQMILQQAMSLKRAIEVILQISHALTHLHAHGIIHRDLKPENILLTAQGGVKVIDFGISQLYTEKEGELAPSGKKRIIGTPVYMSPEQKADPLNVPFSSDVYSLGIITYELVLGRLSHGSIHLSLVPRGLQSILAKALQPNPDDRYEDIVDFIREISGYLTSEEIKKDMRGSDYLGEFRESLKEAQRFLVPTNLPNWPRVEMHVASNSHAAISPVYYDFFMPRDGVFTIVMGEATATDIEGLLAIAMLRGMIRSLAHNMESPAQLISSLNERIVEDKRAFTFSLALLTLFPTEDRFTYISCGYSPLWYLPAGALSPRRLSSDNVVLGVASGEEFFEVSSNWMIGDTLLLHTFQAGLSKDLTDLGALETQFHDALVENLYLSGQPQIDAIYRNVTKKGENALFERPVTLISIVRKM